MAKHLHNYAYRAAGYFGVVQAPTIEHAERDVAKLLKVEHKPWLRREIKVSDATPEDIQLYLELTDVGPRKKDGRNVLREKLDGTQT